jgi:hypothetical protein
LTGTCLTVGFAYHLETRFASKSAGQIDGVFKVIEGAAYSLMLHPDPELDGYLDRLITWIAAAQEPDGYLYTARTIAERNGAVDQLPDNREGKTRYANLRVSHELYNIGHLYKSAVAHYQATGKRTFFVYSFRGTSWHFPFHCPNWGWAPRRWVPPAVFLEKSPTKPRRTRLSTA